MPHAAEGTGLYVLDLHPVKEGKNSAQMAIPKLTRSTPSKSVDNIQGRSWYGRGGLFMPVPWPPAPP